MAELPQFTVGSLAGRVRNHHPALDSHHRVQHGPVRSAGVDAVPQRLPGTHDRKSRSFLRFAAAEGGREQSRTESQCPGGAAPSPCSLSWI